MLTPYLLLFYRARCIDSRNLPADGPAIIAPNHFSFLDHFFVAVYLRRKVHFMAKSQMFKPPLQFIYTHGGVFPVRRGHRDEEAFKTAHAVLARGDVVVMYAEAGARAPASSASRATASGGWRSSPARRLCRRRSRAPSGRATGSASSSPRSPSSSASRSASSRSDEPTREQAQAASEIVFERVRSMHGRLRTEGRRGAVGAARAARRAAEAAGRRPISVD